MKELIEDLRVNADAHPLDVRLSVMIDSADALESQARKIDRLEKDKSRWKELAKDASEQLVSLKLKPSGVVLPERMKWYGLRATACNIRGEGWNACLDEVARLNQPASGVYSADPLACSGCVSGCFRCRTEPASAGDERDQLAAEAAYYRSTLRNVLKDIRDDLVRGGLPPSWSGVAETISVVLSNDRAALSANHSEQVRHMVPAWNLSADVLPASGTPVLACYLNTHGMSRRIRAMHVKRFTVEAEEFADPYTQCVEYSEQEDCYYTTEGWYELIENWPDYSSCAVIEGVITHWMPLPAAPSAGSHGGDV